MASNTSFLFYLVVAILAGIGALIAWTLNDTARLLAQLDALPPFDSQTTGTKSVLEGHISTADHIIVLQPSGMVAFVKEKRTRDIAPTGKPSTALPKWHTKDKTTPPLAVMVGQHQIMVSQYEFPRHVKNWQHATLNTDGTKWTTANTRLKGLLKGGPVVAIGTLQKDGDGTVFEADVLTAGTRQSYRDALTKTREFTGSWVLSAFVAACALFLVLALWSVISGGRNR